MMTAGLLGLCRGGRSWVWTCDWVVAMVGFVSLALMTIQKPGCGSSPESHVCTCVCL